MNDLKKNLEKNLFQIGFDVVGYAKPSVDEKAKQEYDLTKLLEQQQSEYEKAAFGDGRT